MIKWRAIQIEYLSDSWWIVEEVHDDSQEGRRVIYCGEDEALARRIARLLDLEAIVDKLPGMADGVAMIIPEQDVWFYEDDKLIEGFVLSITWGAYFCECLVRDGYGIEHNLDAEDCYGTREAAEAAREEITP